MKTIIHRKVKKAFSLIEVIFVLVILGIVASISSQILIQVYENYLIQRAVYNVSTKTELVASQIVNRLTYRIQGSTISKNHEEFRLGTGNTWLALKDIPTGDTYTSLEWIGYDNDGFAAEQNPTWSGIADYETASITDFNSPASHLVTAANILNQLSNTKVNLNQNKPAAIIFQEDNDFYTGDNTYNPLCMGLIQSDPGSSTNCIFSVKRNGSTGFTFIDPAKPKIITERYQLAWSAYAIAPEDTNGDGLHDLILYSNYQPWNGESYLDTNTSKNILMKNVTVFKFSERGGVIRFKLCASENIAEDFNVTSCKEKAVIR